MQPGYFTSPRFLTLTSLVVMAAVSRLLPHLPNFTPVAAIALFGGVYFTDRKTGFFIPLLIMLLSDLFIGFHGQMFFVYLSFALTTTFGFFIRQNPGAVNVLGLSLVSSVMFFVITNLGMWMESTWYPKTLSGLVECYTAAIPFFRNTLMGDLFFTVILFGSFYLIQQRFPVLVKNNEK